MKDRDQRKLEKARVRVSTMLTLASELGTGIGPDEVCREPRIAPLSRFRSRRICHANRSRRAWRRAPAGRPGSGSAARPAPHAEELTAFIEPARGVFAIRVHAIGQRASPSTGTKWTKPSGRGNGITFLGAAASSRGSLDAVRLPADVLEVLDAEAPEAPCHLPPAPDPRTRIRRQRAALLVGPDRGDHGAGMIPGAAPPPRATSPPGRCSRARGCMGNPGKLQEASLARTVEPA